MSISLAMGSLITLFLTLFVIFPMIGFLVAGLIISIVRKKAGIIVFSVLNGLLYLAVQVTAIIIIIIGAMS